MESRIEHGDCLKLMKNLPPGSIDMILCDLPYGQLNKGNKHADECDRSLNLDCLWNEYRRVIKDNGAIVLFASGMFTADLALQPHMEEGRSCLWFLECKTDAAKKS